MAITREKKQLFSKRRKELCNINEHILAPEVRLVGDNVTMGVYSLSEALSIAETQGLDLVEISVTSDPPVCKVIDYAKYKYIQKKKQKQIKTKRQKVVIKEIRLSPNTDNHDFDFKLKHAITFLESGAKVKVCLKFIGRQIVFKERGELLLLKFSEALEAYGKIEQLPKLEGKRMNLTISPKMIKKSS